MPGPGFGMIGDEERRNVLAALAESTLTRYRFGEPRPETFVYRFEQAAKSRLDAPHALAVNSGTSALLTSLVALGIGPGDQVIVPGYTFIASIAAVVVAGATPVLAEIDESLTLDPRDVENRITERTRAIMPVHMLGVGADMRRLTAVAESHGLAVIEDVAQAFGGSHEGVALGTWGDAGAFSLNVFKVLTSGEGGLCLFADEETYVRAYGFHDHGFRPLRDGAIEGDAAFGLNLRMSDLCGAVAYAQVEKLDRILARTRQLKADLAAAIGDIPHATPRVLPDPSGECATTLSYVFETTELASAVADRLETVPLIASGKHYYGNMPQLRSLSSGWPHRHPASTAPTPLSAQYSRGALPRTDNLLARTIAISTGLSDWYSGTGFGVDVASTANAVARCAERFRSAVVSASRGRRDATPSPVSESSRG